MLCSRCNKRPAVIGVGGYGPQGMQGAMMLCLKCAYEMNIPQINTMLKQYGVRSAADVDLAEERIEKLFKDAPWLASALEKGASSPEDAAKLLGSIKDNLSEEETEQLNAMSEMLMNGELGDAFSDGTDEYADADFIDEADDEEDYTDFDRDDQVYENIDNPGMEIHIFRDGEELDDEEGKAAIGNIFALAAENDEADDGEDEDEDNSGDETPRSLPSPFDKLFGSSFQPGGAGYADGAKGKKKQKKAPKLKFLNSYCTNLTSKAKAGNIDRIVGRDREIERIIQILSRRQKNNPCLIGEPGVGKTAIAEGLALRINDGSVPQRLADKQVYLMDLTALVAGTQFRGQFESRIKGLIDEVRAVGNVILFIDEVHNLVGTGDAEGSMNAANILKPALSRGEIQVIGATTYTEYRKYIEKDSALERRFQPVKVDEPSVADTVEVLRGIKDYYENHHGVTFSDDLLVRTVALSERYITDRFLPDKAIDLLDEACACAALRNKALEESQKLYAEREKLKKREDELSTPKDGKEPDYEKLAVVKSKVAGIDQRLLELGPAARENSVKDADVAHVIELWTGIPAARIEQSEFSKLSNLAENMKKRIKGQDEAIELVANAVRRSRVQISPRRRPASFIFVGPTGVGKTELVKVLAAELFDTPETLIRLDMSEFMEKHSVSRIIGSPPGYVGYDEAGQLTEKVRRKPYSVILFDEIEKAHPDVLNILLQILDEGRINDAQGRTVNFENTVIIMTSNAGSNLNSGSYGFAKSGNEMAKEKAMKALSDFLRPEFLARVDETVCFNALSEENFKEIARLMCDEYIPSLKDKGIELVVQDSAVNYFAEKAMGGKSAARDLRNLIRRELEDRLAAKLIAQSGAAPSRITVRAGKDGIELK